MKKRQPNKQIHHLKSEPGKSKKEKRKKIEMTPQRKDLQVTSHAGS